MDFHRATTSKPRVGRTDTYPAGCGREASVGVEDPVPQPGNAITQRCERAEANDSANGLHPAIGRWAGPHRPASSHDYSRGLSPGRLGIRRVEPNDRRRAEGSGAGPPCRGWGGVRLRYGTLVRLRYLVGSSPNGRPAFSIGANDLRCGTSSRTGWWRRDRSRVARARIICDRPLRSGSPALRIACRLEADGRGETAFHLAHGE